MGESFIKKLTGCHFPPVYQDLAYVKRPLWLTSVHYLVRVENIPKSKPLALLNECIVPASPSSGLCWDIIVFFVVFFN